MKEIIRAVIVAITFVAIVYTFALWGISNEVVGDFFGALGAIVGSALITGCLVVFVNWLSRPNTEEKIGNNTDNEAA